MTFKKIYLYFLITISIISYFLGFYFREISNGAGHTDLQFHIWPLINDFKENYLDTLENYLFYKEATFPFFHSLQSILNPFTSEVINYCFTNTIFNMFILIIFYYLIKKKKIFLKNYELSILLSIIFLLSPWFRSSSYWGMTENLSIFFLLPACFYFSKLINKQDNIQSNILLTLFISLALYSRQQFIFLAIAHLVILIVNKDINKFFYSVFIYILLSIPGLYVYSLWGVFENLNNATSASHYISLKNIYTNVPKISIMILFYLIPILVLNFKKIYDSLKSKKFLFLFGIIFVVEFLLFKGIEYPKKGGGYLIKFNQIFLNNNFYFLIFLSSFFFSLLIWNIKKIDKSFIVLLLSIFIIIGLPEYIYQEWFDPIYLIFIYILLPTSILKNLNLTSSFAIYFLFFWETLILFIAISYYHFFLKIPFFYNF